MMSPITIDFLLVLSDILIAPSAHGEGLHVLLEPLFFVLFAVGAWLFIRFQSQHATDDELDPPSVDE